MKFISIAVFLLATAATVRSQVCYSERLCVGTLYTGISMSQCCDHNIQPDGLSFQTGEGCIPCPVVFGFNQTSLIGVERGESYTVDFGFSSGFSANSIVLANIALNLMTASQADVTVLGGGTVRFTQDGPKTVQISFVLRVDSISEERDETFSLVANVVVGGGSDFGNNPTLTNELRGTIMDNDVSAFLLTEDDYLAAEPDGFIPLRVGRDPSTRLANPVTVRVTPMTVAMAIQRGIIDDSFPDSVISPNRAQEDDFIGNVIEITFPADESTQTQITSLAANIPVVNDDIDEAEEQQFIALLEILNSTGSDSVVQRNFSICRITDDDPLQIGFQLPAYIFEEPPNDSLIRDVMLIKEGNRITEQTYSVVVSVSNPPPPLNPATLQDAQGGNYDYSLGSPGASSLVLEFGPNQQNRTFAFELTSDKIAEGTEGFEATSTANQGFPTFGAPQNISATTLITILDDEFVVVGFEESMYTASENDGFVEIGVVMTNPSLNETLGFDVILEYQTRRGTADGNDFGEVGPFMGVLRFPAGTNRRRMYFNITIANDGAQEMNETFTVVLSPDSFSPVSSIQIQPNTTEVLIMDGDPRTSVPPTTALTTTPSPTTPPPPPPVTIGFLQDSYIVDEDDGMVSVRVGVRSGSVRDEILVEFFLFDESAKSMDDYSSESNQSVLIFNSNNTEYTVQILIMNDTIQEPMEIFAAQLALMNQSSQTVTLSPDRVLIIIEDDDIVTVEFDPTLYAVNESAGTVRFMIVKRGSSTNDTTVIFYTSDGSATGDDDYEAIENATVTFTPAQTEQFVDVTINDDSVLESNEDFLGLLSLPSGSVGVSLGDRLATATILDNDLVTVEFDPTSYTVNENAGTVRFVIVKRESSTSDIMVLFSTRNDSATGDDDYGAVQNTMVIFTPVQTQQFVDVTINDDSVLEGNETFQGVLSLPSGSNGVSLGDNMATVTILDNDPVVIGFDPVVYSSPEGESVTFIVSLTGGSITQDIMVDFQTIAGTATFEDYDNSSVMLTFRPGGATILPVPILGFEDDQVEGNEEYTATLELSDPPDGVSLGDDTARATIIDDDSLIVGFDPSSYSVNEGESIDLIVRLSQAPPQAVTVQIGTMDQTAVAPDDYVNISSSIITFQVGVMEQNVSIQTSTDDISEDVERFTAILSSPNGAVLGVSEATVDITDNSSVLVEFDPVAYNVRENEALVEFVIKKRTQTTRTVTVIFTAQPITAQASSDYGDMPRLRVTFEPDRNENAGIVSIRNDDIYEGNETFLGILSLPSGSERVALGESIAIVTILDDDVVTVEFDPASYSVMEGMDASIIVVVRGDFNTSVSVLFTTQDLSATAPDDYNGVAQMLSFEPGTTQLTVEVATNSDQTIEADEIFNAMLSSPSAGVRLGEATASVIIEDFTEAVVIGFDQESYSVNERDGNALIRVSVISGTPSTDLKVEFETFDITAASGNDYISVTENLTFTASNRTSEVNIPLINDNIPEPTEIFMARLSSDAPSNILTLDPFSAMITITDDDSVPPVGTSVNDTVIGDPLMEVPILVSEPQLNMLDADRLSLCYELHGRPRQWFNLVTDECASVNAQYINATQSVNVIDQIGVRALDTSNKCVNIRVKINGCFAEVNGIPTMRYSSDGISMKTYSNRIRISVPNCASISLVMWVICEKSNIEGQDIDAIKFVVMRGLNFGRRAHGLLGQFWNVPVGITPYTGLTIDGTPEPSTLYIVNITRGTSTRRFVGHLHKVGWEGRPGPCLYVGNRQAGGIVEIEQPNDGVVEGDYKDYQVSSAFSEENYKFGLFNEKDKGSGSGLSTSSFFEF